MELYSPGQVPHLTGASSHMQKGCSSDPWSRCVCKRQPINVSSHMDVPLSFSLPSSLSKINEHIYPQVRAEKKN